MMCGVGPLAIRAAAQGNFVLANDLNPDAYKWLQVNVKKNKMSHLVKCANKCAREFLHESIKSNNDNEFSHFDHVYMNLPGNAVEFLDVF
jgi:tRNA (guanine37-N1)-methyltransferase